MIWQDAQPILKGEDHEQHLAQHHVFRRNDFSY